MRLAYGLFLPDIQASLSMSSSVAGYVSSGASAAYCAGALAGLVAADRPLLLVTGALGTASAGSIGMAIAPDLVVLIPSVILASAGAGLASPGLVAVVGRSLPAAHVDQAQARVNAGTGPGLVAAGLLALLLSQWRIGFVISAVFTAAAGFCVLLLARSGPFLDAPTTASDEAASQVRRSARPRRGAWSTLGSQRWLIALLRPATGAAILGAASATVWTYGRAQLVSSGTGESGSIVAWIGIGVGGTTTVLTARMLSAWSPPRAWLVTASAVAVATAGLSAPGRLPVAVIACAVFGWGFVAATSALIAWTAQLVPRRTAAGTSVVFIALVLGQAAGSAAAGAFSARAGLSTTFLMAAFTTLLAASCGGSRRLDPARHDDGADACVSSS